MSLAWTLPIFSGLADAGMRSVIKLSNIPAFILISGGYLFALPFYAVWLLLTGIPEIKTVFWYVIVAHVPLMVLANILTVKAHRSSPLILTAPYLSLTPAFLLITAPLMGGGVPTSGGIFGVVLITLGIYVLNTKQNQVSILDPLQQLKKEKGSRLMFAVGAIFAITSNFDYLGFANANAPYYLFIDHGLVGLACLTVALIDKSFNKNNYKNGLAPKGFLPLLLFGITIALSCIPHVLAFNWIPNVPYVIAGKRAGAISFTVTMGIVVASMKKFKHDHKEEKKHLQYRIPGTIIILLGMILIIWRG